MSHGKRRNVLEHPSSWRFKGDIPHILPERIFEASHSAPNSTGLPPLLDELLPNQQPIYCNALASTAGRKWQMGKAVVSVRRLAFKFKLFLWTMQISLYCKCHFHILLLRLKITFLHVSDFS
jgi:hypothetical protein